MKARRKRFAGSLKYRRNTVFCCAIHPRRAVPALRLAGPQAVRTASIPDDPAKTALRASGRRYLGFDVVDRAPAVQNEARVAPPTRPVG